MAKGRTVLKIAGILLVVFGVLCILFAMLYGFVGALHSREAGQEMLTGLLIFYGLFGILTGFFQIAAGAMSIRHSNIANHWLRCVIWGLVILAIGCFCYVLFRLTSGMIPEGGVFYPQWFCHVILIAGCFVLPVLMILGGLLNIITHKKEKAEAASLQVKEMAAPVPEDYIGEMASVEEAAAAHGFAPKSGGRLDYLKSKRLSRNVNPRTRRKFAR